MLFRSVITYALTTPPDIAIYDVDGNYTSVVRDGWSSPNPIAQALSKDISQIKLNLLPNAGTEIHRPVTENQVVKMSTSETELKS